MRHRSVLLSRWLLTVTSEPFDVCVELGAGSVLSVMVAAACGLARAVALTDLPLAVPWLEHNIALNVPSVRAVTTAASLLWGSDAVALLSRAGPNARVLLLCSDCLLPYSVEAFPLLADTIARALHGAAPASVCMLSYEERCDVSGFFASLAALRCDWRVIRSHDACHLLAIHAQH